MRPKGWIATEITSQEQILPSLRVAHELTLQALGNNHPPVIVELDQWEQM